MNRFKPVSEFNGIKPGDKIHIKRWYFEEGSPNFSNIYNSVAVDVVVPVEKITVNENDGIATFWCGRYSTTSNDIANKGIVKN